MPVLVLVGAGPGLGQAIALRFGREGFTVALIARNPERLSALVDDLREQGVTAHGFAADILDRPSLVSAIEQVSEKLGRIDVLEFSPADVRTAQLAPATVWEASPENTQPQVEFYLYGAMTAIRSVLPAMRDAGTGTILVTTGAGSAEPVPYFGNISAATGGLRNYVLNLASAVAPEGIHVAHVALKLIISADPIDGRVTMAPELLADLYWQLYERRDTHEIIVRGEGSLS